MLSPSQTSKIKMANDQNPSVIESQMIFDALGINQLSIGEENDTDFETSRNFILKTTRTLRLEFKRILKIENLQVLTSLSRLFLDNNFIERISGLEALRKLEVLALYNNEIEKIENLDHLKNLKVLRLGRNKITNRDDIIYLRRLESLKTLSIKDNPFCQEEDWTEFVVALLPNLVYLECHFISKEQKDASILKYQGDIFRAQNQEEAAKEDSKNNRKTEIKAKGCKTAFAESLQGHELLQVLIECNADQEKELVDCIDRWHKDQGGMRVIWEQFEQEMVAIGDEIYQLGLKELKLRGEEVKIFEDCVKEAQGKSQGKGIAEIDTYLEEKDNIFEAVFDLASQFEDKEPEEITDLQREEVEKLRETFNTKTKDLWNVIMSNEVTLVNQVEQILSIFEQNINTMMDNFMDLVKKLFVKARAVDIKYFQRLSELGESIEELPYSVNPKHYNSLEEGMKVSNLIADCHDGHQRVLMEEEEKLHVASVKWKEDYLNKFKKKERKRNRNRILELNHFIDTMRREEDEDLDVVPSNEFNIGEDILLID